MPGRAEQLFHSLNSGEAIRALIGQSEDAHLECKEWPKKDEEAQKVFAKAACGLTNADGGVLVVGMKAKATSKDEPDLIVSAEPVGDTSVVKSRILDLVGQLVEPSIEGVEVIEVNPTPDSKSGFVIVYIPVSQGFPRRSRKDWKFYLRIGSGTFPMEYFQIADMFGKRPQPILELYFEPTGEIGPIPYDTAPHRFFWIGLFNGGRGIAKFPAIRFKRASDLKLFTFGLDGNKNHGLPLRPSESEWVVFRGGVDDVIFPGTTLKVTQLIQRYSSVDSQKGIWIFDSLGFSVEISYEGGPNVTAERIIPEYRHG